MIWSNIFNYLHIYHRSSGDVHLALVKLLTFETRPAIHTLLRTKFEYIMLRYIEEIRETELEFEVNLLNVTLTLKNNEYFY
jgi:hypothetical protein